MNYENKDLIYKISENTIKSRQKARMFQKFFITVLKEYLILLYSFKKKHIRFDSQRDYKNLKIKRSVLL